MLQVTLHDKFIYLSYILVRDRYRKSIKSSHSFPGCWHEPQSGDYVCLFDTEKHAQKKMVERWDIEKIMNCKQNFTKAVDEHVKVAGTTDARWKHLK